MNDGNITTPTSIPPQPEPLGDVLLHSDPPLIAPILAALANSQHGGRLHIRAGGKHDAVDLVDRIVQAALLVVPRLVIPVPRVVEVEGKSIVLAEVPAGMPHVYATEGRYLIREHGQNVPIHPHDLRRMLIERGDIQFEAEPAYGATLNDIDWDQARMYAARLGLGTDRDAIQRCLMRRGCLIQDPEMPYLADALRPTNAGILLFGREVQSLLRGAEITAVRFAGEVMSDTFTRQDITGTLPDQIRRAETFLRDHLRKEQRLKATMQRAESYEYPLEAARELVVNAVAHRDYSINGDGIRLYIFKDRMEITSPGRLPGPVTINNIADERFSRNPIIVQVLADMGFIERLGYGVDRVLELMRQQHLLAPTFRETDGGFRVTLYNEPQAHLGISPVEPIEQDLEDETLDETTPTAEPAPPAPTLTASAVLNLTPEVVEQQLAEYRGISLSARQETALVFLKQPHNTRITNSELQRFYPDVHQETIRRDLSDLVTKNLLVKMGEKRGSYYILRRNTPQSTDPSL